MFCEAVKSLLLLICNIFCDLHQRFPPRIPEVGCSDSADCVFSCVCVCVADSACSAVLRRNNEKQRTSSRISLHCKNTRPSWVARAICWCVCLKPDEYARETTGRDRSPTAAPVSSRESRPPDIQKSDLAGSSSAT